MAILEIQQVSKCFGDNLVVDNISIQIEQGEFFTLLGPSGCGKTTLLRMIAGFCIPDSGKILLDGKDITNLAPEDRPLHTIFQSYALFPHLTVFENIAFPLKMSGCDKSQIAERVNKILADVKLVQFTNRYPRDLSGGQKQRVAIARSLVNRPKLLLLDEPLSALDARLRQHMHVELVRLQEETGITFVYVTHDQSEALALSSRIAVLNQGKVEQLDKPQIIYAKPKTYFIADFLGKCNLFKAQIMDITGKTMRLKVAEEMEFELESNEADSFKAGQTGWYSIRPEKLRLKRDFVAENGVYTVKAKVNGWYYYGEATLYEFSLSNGVKFQAMLANTEQVSFFADNSEVYVYFEASAGNFIAS